MEVKALEGPFGAEVRGPGLTVPLIAGEREAAGRRSFAEPLPHRDARERPVPAA